MDSVMLVGRLLVSLACVLGVVWVIARKFRKGPRARSARVLEVLDRTPLTRSSSVAIVRVGDKALVLGVADAHVSVLGETDLAAARAAHATTTGPKRAARRGAANPRVAVPAPAHFAAEAAAPAGALAGSALSPQTWRQTIESLRDLTSRT